jgi:DNA repair photolyase
MTTTKTATAPHGTKEWAEHNVNIQTGCEHDCRYCYAKSMAVRFKRATPESWQEPVIRPATISKAYRKKSGRTMFPTSHDITESNVGECLIILKKLLSSSNDVLIVSKPRVAVIESLIAELEPYRDQITFRFSIGSTSDNALGFWEPGAPSFDERIRSLQLAHDSGFQTSVSCEPMLDQHIGRVIEAARPFVIDSIWLGKANRLRCILAFNCPDDDDAQAAAAQLIAWQSDDEIIALYEMYRHDPVIKWKDSIKKVVGIDRPTEAGLDV